MFRLLNEFLIDVSLLFETINMVLEAPDKHRRQTKVAFWSDCLLSLLLSHLSALSTLCAKLIELDLDL